MNTPIRPTAAGICSEVQNILAIALATPKEVADVFVDFSAHVNCVHVKVHAHGWREGAEAVFTDDCYTDGYNVCAKLLVLRQRLEECLHDLANVSEKERAAIKAKAIRARAEKLLAEADAIEGKPDPDPAAEPLPTVPVHIPESRELVSATADAANPL